MNPNPDCRRLRPRPLPFGHPDCVGAGPHPEAPAVPEPHSLMGPVCYLNNRGVNPLFETTRETGKIIVVGGKK
jgi:hypothetical protein